MTTPTDWWNGFFTGLFADFWRAAIPPEMTRADVDFFEKELELAPGARVLDVPCGHGRHSLELARRGFRVTGVDFSADLLSAARRSSEEQALAIEWVERDMRDLPWRGEFDAALCAGNSFGYFDDAGNRAFLEAAALAVKPGGRFLLDSGWIAEALFPHFHQRLEMDVSGLRFVAENRYDPAQGRVENRFTVSRGALSETRPAAHRVYTYRELAQMLEDAGLADLAAFGSLTGEPFALGSPRLLLVGVRS
jgi:SAM-dependent methyltransferase